MEFLGFGKEARAKTDENFLIMTPLKEEKFDFSDLILEVLMKEGKKKPLKEFKKRNGKIKLAINKLSEEAKNNSVTTEDIFKDD